MHKVAATLEKGGIPVEQSAATQVIRSPGAGVVKFSYASGSRPLDGYTIKRGVGVGGFGEVYYAVSDAGKEVALKRIQRNLDIELRGVSQCLNLKHPHLLSLYDVRYNDAGEAWVIMEFVSGESLKDAIDRNPSGLPREEVHRWFGQIAAGVQHLHDHGIVHRDLKPGNIFMDHGVVKIGDYGLSKFISCSRRSGQTESVGTFHYMAPEIGKGIYGKEIDVYALGVLLYEMLTGKLPFDGESSQEIIMKHLTADPDLSGLPRPYRGVIQRALFKDPAKRYANVPEMVRDLELDARPFLAESGRAAPVAAAAEPVAASRTSDEILFGPVRHWAPDPAIPPRVTSPVRSRARTLHADEPIARALRHQWRSLISWWNTAQLSAPVKVILLVVGAITLVMNSEWLIPLSVLMGAMYLVYFGVRTLLLALDGPPSQTAVPVSAPPSATQTVAVSLPPPSRPARARHLAAHRRNSGKEAARLHLRHKTWAERSAELTGAMLMAALVAGVLSLVALLVGGKPVDASVYTWSFYIWLAVTSTVSAWVVLALGKIWEPTDGEPIRRRFVMLMVGLLLGAFVFAFRDFLGVRLTDDLVVQALPHLPASMYGADGSPRLPAYLLYFAGIFAIVRWWKQADPLRNTRLSILDTGACVLFAWLLQMCIPFYQPWGFMLAAITSVAVQLSAPWMSVAERERIRHQNLEG